MDKLKKKFPFSPLFILMFILLLISGNIIFFLTFFIAVCLHEFGHAFVAKKLGYKLNKIYFAPYGVSLNYKENVFKVDDEILIAVSGPALNLIICIVLISLWWIFPLSYAITSDFVFCNFILAIFNFIPAYPLDGGRILVSSLSKNIDRVKALKIARISNYIFCFILFVCFIISLFFKPNFTLSFAVIFLLGGVIDTKFESKYEKLRYISRKDNSIPLKVFTLAVPSTMQIYKVVNKLSRTRYNIIYVRMPDGKIKTINEELLEKITMSFDPDKTFYDILSRKK